jgi:hypothetical protein
VPSLDQTAATNLIAALLGVTAFPSVPGTHIRLGTTTPTATSDMTELTGTGYTAGGQSVTWASPAAGVTHNSSAPSWTNSGTGAWAIVGVEIWTTNGTPVRQMFGIWAGAPITISPGNEFSVAAGGISASLA